MSNKNKQLKNNDMLLIINFNQNKYITFLIEQFFNNILDLDDDDSIIYKLNNGYTKIILDTYGGDIIANDIIFYISNFTFKTFFFIIIDSFLKITFFTFIV